MKPCCLNYEAAITATRRRFRFKVKRSGSVLSYRQLQQALNDQ